MLDATLGCKLFPLLLGPRHTRRGGLVYFLLFTSTRLFALKGFPALKTACPGVPLACYAANMPLICNARSDEGIAATLLQPTAVYIAAAPFCSDGESRQLTVIQLDLDGDDVPSWCTLALPSCLDLADVVRRHSCPTVCCTQATTSFAERLGTAHIQRSHSGFIWHVSFDGQC